MLLYEQLQGGFIIFSSLIESSLVSGAQNYQDLIITAKKEEQRLAEFRMKQSYLITEMPPESLTKRSFQRNYNM